MTGNGSLNHPFDLVSALSNDVYHAGDFTKLMGGIYSGNFTCRAGGSSTSPVTYLPYQSESPKINGSLNIGVSGVIFKDLYINNDSFTDRSSGNVNAGVRVDYSNVLIQDCIISNTSMGVYTSEDLENVVIDGCIIFYNGWLDSVIGGQGHGVYVHGKNTTIKNCIIYCNADMGLQVYGLVNHDNLIFENNISYMTHEMWRIQFQYGMNYVLSVGSGAVLRNNCSYAVAGSRRANEISQMGDGILTDNYLVEGIYQYNPASWAQTSGNVFAPEATNSVKVFSVRGRAHVAVYNWQLLNSVSVNISSVFPDGAVVKCRNVQDYWNDIQTLTVSSGSITVNMQSANRTVAAPQGVSAPVNVFPEFGCFVVESA